MNFCSKATLRWLAIWAGRLAALAGVVSVGVIAACGGSTSQASTFVPQRLLVFGDDLSALDPLGENYSVNGLNATGSLNCAGEPIWVQSLANIYNFTFAQCNPTSDPEPKALMLAFAGAKVDDVAAQVEQQVASGGFHGGDLATVLAGANDIWELYAQYPSLSQADLVAEAGARGKRLAQVVNRLVNLGAKVIVSDLPDLGMTPFAIAQQALGAGGPDRAALITSLIVAFNEQLGVNVLLDGRYVGLVQAQLRFQSIARSPASFGLTDIVDAVCTLPPPTCTTATLVTSTALPGAYLWSDDTRLAPGGHSQLASLAIDRARRNPF